MELRHLLSFATLAEERHFGRAAARLHLAQPALSAHVKQLEQELGVQLVNRTTRRVELTEAGRRFAEHARGVLAGVDRAREEMALLASGRSGRVTAGFIGSATYDLLPRVAREARDRLPGVALEVRGELLSPALLDGLLERTYDVVVLRPGGTRGSAPAGVALRRLRTERLVAALPARHALATRKRLRLAELAGEPFVMHPSGERSSIHGRVVEACRAAGFTPRAVTEVGETATLAVFVAAGIGAALVPEPVRSLGVEGVAYVPLVAAPTIDLALAVRAGEQSPATLRVADIVARCAGPAVAGAHR